MSFADFCKENGLDADKFAMRVCLQSREPDREFRDWAAKHNRPSQLGYWRAPFKNMMKQAVRRASRESRENREKEGGLT